MREIIEQIKQIEQNLQTVLMQKNAINSQIFEIDSSLKEIDSSKESYKIIGSVMVLSDKENLKKELFDSKESLQVRLKTLEKQEDMLKSRLSGLQKEAVEKSKKLGDENVKN